MADVATYFEDRGELEKAVQLYQRAGDLSRALDLCFRAAAAQVVKCASIVLY
jgi:intraflagellar transport protein 140